MHPIGISVQLLLVIVSTASAFNVQLPLSFTSDDSASPLFIRGLSTAATDTLHFFPKIQPTHVRCYAMWKYVEGTIHGPLPTNLTIPAMQSNPEAFVYNWGRNVDWRPVDSQIEDILGASWGVTDGRGGVKSRTAGIILEVGEGTFNGQPSYIPSTSSSSSPYPSSTSSDTNITLELSKKFPNLAKKLESSSATETVNPSLVGKDLYIAYQYRFARAAVWKYKPLILNGTIVMLQLENELNEAFLSSVAGDRPFSFDWADWGFLTELLSALRQAVIDEMSSSSNQLSSSSTLATVVPVTTNLHSDVPKSVHDLLNVTGYYADAAKDWGPLVDGLLSIDAYPNMFVASLNVTHQVADRVRVVQGIVAAAPSSSSLSSKGVSGWDPSRVFVMETGYPVNAAPSPNVTATPSPPPIPSVFDFSETNQAQFISMVLQDLRAANAGGLIYFKLVESPGMPPPTGGSYTPEDIRLYQALFEFTQRGEDIGVLIEWLLEPGSLEEALTRAAMLLKRPPLGWGLVREDGTARPGIVALSASKVDT